MEINYNMLDYFFCNINRDLYIALDTFCPSAKKELQEGLKYFGFYIKPNKYLIKDWY